MQVLWHTLGLFGRFAEGVEIRDRARGALAITKSLSAV